jgi:hypothetical protein
MVMLSTNTHYPSQLPTMDTFLFKSCVADRTIIVMTMQTLCGQFTHDDVFQAPLNQWPLIKKDNFNLCHTEGYV